MRINLHGFYSFLLALAVCVPAACMATGCTKNTEQDNGQPVEPPEEIEEPEEPWTGEYPRGVEVESFSDDMGGGAICNGWTVTADFSANSRLKFNTVLNQSSSANILKKPTAIFNDFNRKNGEPCIVVNAGYFGGSNSVSLCVTSGLVKCIHPRIFNWPSDEAAKYQIYTVRSAMGQLRDGKFEIQWAYCPLGGTKPYAYESPMGNDEKTETFITEMPTAAQGTLWEPYMAVGGGPRILKDGENVAVENYWAECLDAGGTAGLSRQPRTGIGITADNRLIIIVCDGRGMGGSVGMTLSEMAEKFKSFGAIDAMNLDGGGSSQIVGHDGTVLNNPSDGSERAVSTAIVISELEEEL